MDAPLFRIVILKRNLGMIFGLLELHNLSDIMNENDFGNFKKFVFSNLSILHSQLNPKSTLWDPFL